MGDDAGPMLRPQMPVPDSDAMAASQALTARIEAEIAIATLLRRLPDLRLDDAVNPEWRASFVLRGLKRLPASW